MTRALGTFVFAAGEQGSLFLGELDRLTHVFEGAAAIVRRPFVFAATEIAGCHPLRMIVMRFVNLDDPVPGLDRLRVVLLPFAESGDIAERSSQLQTPSPVALFVGGDDLLDQRLRLFGL